MGPTVLMRRGLSLQVCVPQDWSDKQIIEFAEDDTPCGTLSGWQVRKEGDKALQGAPERNPCSHHAGFTHVVVDA